MDVGLSCAVEMAPLYCSLLTIMQRDAEVDITCLQDFFEVVVDDDEEGHRGPQGHREP